jgi:hypothetical protein
MFPLSAACSVPRRHGLLNISGGTREVKGTDSLLKVDLRQASMRKRVKSIKWSCLSIKAHSCSGQGMAARMGEKIEMDNNMDDRNHIQMGQLYATDARQGCDRHRCIENGQ